MPMGMLSTQHTSASARASPKERCLHNNWDWTTGETIHSPAQVGAILESFKEIVSNRFSHNGFHPLPCLFFIFLRVRGIQLEIKLLTEKLLSTTQCKIRTRTGQFIHVANKPEWLTNYTELAPSQAYLRLHVGIDSRFGSPVCHCGFVIR